MAIDDRFLNFKPETRRLISHYHVTRDPALVSPILHAVLEKYLPEGAPPRLDETMASLNAFGLESLALVQVVLDVEEVLGVTLSDDQWKHIRTFDEAGSLLRREVARVYTKTSPAT